MYAFLFMLIFVAFPALANPAPASANPVPAMAAEIEIAPGHNLTRQHILDLTGLEYLDEADRRQVWRFQQPVLPMRNEASSPVTIAVSGQDFQDASGRLQLTLDARLATGESSRLLVMATSTEEWLVPVPAMDLASGTLIGAADLDWQWIDRRRLRSDAVVDPNDLIGREVRRNLRAGRTVAANMVQEMRLIRRGELVEVTYDRAGLVLNLVAEAMEDGAAGSLVRLRNLDSGKRLVARATGLGIASIDGSVR